MNSKHITAVLMLYNSLISSKQVYNKRVENQKRTLDRYISFSFKKKKKSSLQLVTIM